MTARTAQPGTGRIPSDQEIHDRIQEIDRDERYHYPPARVDVNAPLALIQVSLDTEARALAWSIGAKAPTPGPKKKKARKIMSRLQMSGNLPAEYAERVSDVGDDLTPAEEAQIEARADELMAERRENPDLRREIIRDLDPDCYVGQLDRALQNIDNAIHRDEIGRTAVLTALVQIQRAVFNAQEAEWREECREQAKRELP